MNNVNITPYPNLQITDDCFERDIIGNSELQGPNNEKPIENTANVTVLEYENGKRRVSRFGPHISFGSENYAAVFPNPVLLFISSAINSNNICEKIKHESFPNCAAKSGKKLGDINLLDADADETHACYNEFFKMRMNAVIMLSTAVESFINYSIPIGYPNRERIERYEKFSEKLNSHLPASLNLTDFWNNKIDLNQSLLALYRLRNDIIHLKTNSEEGFNAYFTVIDSLVKYNLEQAIYDVKSFMNDISPGFIKDIQD